MDPKPDASTKGENVKEKFLEPFVKDDWLVEFIKVPVLATKRSAWVEGGTMGVVLVAFLGLCWVLFGRGGGKKVEVAEKKKQ